VRALKRLHAVDAVDGGAVRSESAIRGEPLSALAALERFLTGMYHLVQLSTV